MPRFVGPDGVSTIPVSADNPLPVTLGGGGGGGGGGSQQTTTRTEVSTATTTNITAGATSYSVTCKAASSESSPTLDGVALSLGETVTRVAAVGHTLEGAVVVTASGDRVVIDEVR